jgi:uncharacterized membrane protein YraQ (UPF0718 family)
MNQGIKKVLVGYCYPSIRSQLRSNGIEVITGIEGSVKEALDKYRDKVLQTGQDSEIRARNSRIDKALLIEATRKTIRQFVSLLPVLIGVVLLVGLFQAFVSNDILTSIFPGNVFLDTLWAAVFGSVVAGNPINSYIIGGELLDSGISLFAVTAFILTWVTVGIVQLPAEIAALGRKFALVRNGLAFVFSIPISIITVVILNLVSG